MFFETDRERAVVAALGYLGPEIEVTEIADNATQPPVYGKANRPNCWRIYFGLKKTMPATTGGSSPFVLVEKGTNRILETGAEAGE